MRRSYILPGLIRSLNEDERYAAKSAVLEFQTTPAWYSLQQKLEGLRDTKLRELTGAAKREHLELAENAGVIRAIDEVYEMFEKIIREGNQD